MASNTRLTFRLFIVLALAATVASCASRRNPSLLHPVNDAAGVGTAVKVLVATTRTRLSPNSQDFTNGRNFGLSYEEYSISIPPGHLPGRIEWPSSLPGDPAQNFVATSASTLDKNGFEKALLAGKKGGDVIVFVHGYNTSYQKAVFRVAELSRDGGFTDPVVAFAWPSLGTVTGYVGDRESATYSRDYLENFLNDLARAPGVKHIHIIAHSMGNWLTVETLRQAKIRGASAFLPKLGEVFLMSPDIDVDVFRTELDAIGKLNEPLTIGISRDDRALGAIQQLAGNVPRVGNLPIGSPDTQAAIRRYGLRVIDMSNQKDLNLLNHSKFVSILPALHELTMDDAIAARGNPVSQTGVFAVGTAGTLLTAPLRLGEAIAGE
jgi:esterase/lipase superfamily enzyme